MKGWKTVVFGAALALTSILSNPEMQVFVSENLPWLGGIAGAIVVGLRALTSSSIFKSD